MTLAGTTRALPGAGTPDALVTALRAADLRRVVLLDPAPQARAWRPTLASGGVEVVAVALEAGLSDLLDAPRVAAALEPAIAVASALRAGQVLIPGGRIPGRAGAQIADHARALPAALRGAADEAQRLRDLMASERGAVREGLVERTARALHAPLAAGVPLAVVNGGHAADLLHLDEMGWLLDALPRLSLWLDPARALALELLGLDAGPLAFADRHARRVAGVLVHGLGSDGLGHAHPEDRGPPWGRLGETLPQRVPWVLDLSGRHDASDLRDAARFLRAALAAPGGRA